MAILKAEKLEIEIQEQTIHNPGSKYFVLIKCENENQNILKKSKYFFRKLRQRRKNFS